jgi:hypothetical protein
MHNNKNNKNKNAHQSRFLEAPLVWQADCELKNHEPSRAKLKILQLGLNSSLIYTLDVLWGQPINLIQVASNSELNQWNDLLFFEIVPSHCFGASEASKIDCFKN